MLIASSWLVVGLLCGYALRHYQRRIVRFVKGLLMNGARGTRPTKPRGLGSRGRSYATKADLALTAAEYELQPIYDGRVKNVDEAKSLAGRVMSNIHLAMYHVANLFTLGHSDEGAAREEETLP